MIDIPLTDGTIVSVCPDCVLAVRDMAGHTAQSTIYMAIGVTLTAARSRFAVLDLLGFPPSTPTP